MKSQDAVLVDGRCYEVGQDETILQALLRQGARPRHSCGRGSCHVCVMRCVAGEVESSHPNHAAMQRDAHVLPCVSRPRGLAVLAPADPAALGFPGEIVAVQRLAPQVAEVCIAPTRALAFQAGQHVHLWLGSEADFSRPYSIVSQPGEDYFFRIHVRAVEGGRLSRWLVHDATAGARVMLRGPSGGCIYREDMRDAPLLLMATGTGAGALLGVATAALAQGHRGGIEFHHGGRTVEDLHLDAKLRQLASSHGNFVYVPALSRDTRPGPFRRGRVTEYAFAAGHDLSRHHIFLCGSPLMVEEARYLAMRAAARRERIHADAFTFAHPPLPRDSEKLASIGPDPELWSALDRGPRLTAILRDFYTRVFADPRLAPFFQGMTVEYVAAKQYSFLAQVFSGERSFFGLNPYNAHHWMVISDELFDHREALFEQVLREHGLPEPLIRRWIALHELFRTEIVKRAPRGLLVDGQELPLRHDTIETLDLATVCDRCHGEIPAGTRTRYVHRLGELHCPACAGLPEIRRKSGPTTETPQRHA